MRKNSYLIAILFILMSAIGFSTLQMFVKLAKNVTLIDKLFFRNFIITIICFSMIMYNKVSLKVPKSEILLLTSRSIAGLLGVVISFYTLMLIPLADSTIIQKLSSLCMMFFSYIFFKEKFSLKQLFAIIIAFIGVCFIVKPGSSNFSFGYILALLGMLCATLAYCSIRAMGLRNRINPLLIIFYFSLSTNILLLPYLIFNFNIYTLRDYTILLAIGIFGAIGQYGITFAYKFASSKEVSIFEYSQVIFSSVLGIIFLNEYPDKYTLIGYLIIIGAAYWMFLYNKPKKGLTSKNRS